MLWRVGVKMDHAKSSFIGTAFWKKEKKNWKQNQRDAF